MSEQHTKGPYRVCGAGRGGCPCGLVWSVSADVVVAHVPSHKDEAITGGEGASEEAAAANARRIAAALTATESLPVAELERGVVGDLIALCRDLHRLAFIGAKFTPSELARMDSLATDLLSRLPPSLPTTEGR